MSDKTIESERRKEKILRLLADDSYAASFQTLGQYRSALIKEIVKIESKGTSDEQASRSSVDAVVMNEPYIPFSKPIGMSDEQYAQEIDEAYWKYAESQQYQHEMGKEMMRETILAVKHAIKNSKLYNGGIALGDKLKAQILSFE